MTEAPFDPINVAAHLPALAESLPEALAVAVARTDGTYATLTFAELNARCDRVAHALVAGGVGEGTRAVLMVPPSPEFFALVFALFKVGAVPVLVDPGMGIRNLKQCLKESSPSSFIGVPKAHVARVALGWAETAAGSLITVGGWRLWGGVTLASLEAAASDEPFAMVEPDADQVAAILFTSGSTGVPKGAEYTHGNFSGQVRLLRATYGIEPGERDLATFPLFALFGPGLGMASVVPLMDASRPAAADPEDLWRACADFECTNLFASPALIDKLGRWCEQQGRRLPTLRRALSAGAPASIAALRRFAPLLDDAEVHTPYGATEALPVASIGSSEILGETAARTEQGEGVCVGRPVQGVTVRVIEISDEPIDAWDDALSVPGGQIGEFVVSGPTVTRRYFGRDESTKLAKIADPDAPGGVRHRMGDVGWIDDEGRLWMCGRKSHRVITPDGPLFTVPCEAVFNSHPEVFRTALVGVDGAPVLCVELEAKRGDRGRITADLRRLGEGHEHTRSIQRFLFHKGFPVDVRHNAKIFRERLAIWAADATR